MDDAGSASWSKSSASELLKVLDRPVDRGNTVVIIEHHPDIIKVADWIIDLGPEGGDEGGWVVAQGTHEEVAESLECYTGQLLKTVLDGASCPL